MTTFIRNDALLSLELAAYRCIIYTSAAAFSQKNSAQAMTTPSVVRKFIFSHPQTIPELEF